MSVTGIIIYPIKAMQGIPLPSSRLRASKLHYDRSFCVVDSVGIRYPKNTALSMRQLPKLASIEVHIDLNDHIILQNPENPEDFVKFPITLNQEEGPPEILVECAGASTTSSAEDGAWHLGHVKCREQMKNVSEWLSEILNDIDSSHKAKKKERTVYKLMRCVDDHSESRLVSNWAGPSSKPFSADVSKQRNNDASPFKFSHLKVNTSDRITFQDAFPVNILNMASFRSLQADLRERFADNPEMLKKVNDYNPISFRPNIIIDGFRPYEEEDFGDFTIGMLPFRGLKGCPRCTVPAMGSEGEWVFSAKGEQLAYQKVLRKRFPKKCIDDEWGKAWQGVIFTMHCAYRGEENQFIHVGDAVAVHTRLGSWFNSKQIEKIANKYGFLALGWVIAVFYLASAMTKM